MDQYLRQGNGYTTSWKFPHKETLYSRLYSIEIEFHFQKNRFLSHLRGNVRTPSIACWKARGRLPIRHNWTFFGIAYGWDVISRNLSTSTFFEGGESVLAQISDGRGRRPPTTVGVRKLQWLPFRVISKYPQCSFVTHKARVWQTDRLTDRQNYDSYAALA